MIKAVYNFELPFFDPTYAADSGEKVGFLVLFKRRDFDLAPIAAAVQLPNT
jgi:hypothetical protein